MNDNDEFVDECIREHNKYRKLHGVEPLRHSLVLDRTAQEWAKMLLQKENVTNSPLSNKGEIGESISKRTSTLNSANIKGFELINQWYNDIRSYDFETHTGPAGNFTQMVWAATREVGFGKAGLDGQCVVVAHYRPPGNIRGRYANNVFPAIPENSANHTNATMNGSKDIIKTVITREKGFDAHGHEQTIIREVIDTKISDGNIHRRVVERFADDSDTAQYPKQQNGLSLASPQIIPTPPSKQSLMEFAEDMLNLHNRSRRLHGAPDLILSGRLNAMAQEWAEFLVDEVCLSNSGFTLDGLRLGENITSRWSNGELEQSADDVISSWYQESTRFKYGREPVSIQGIGNFTQLVWTSTRNLGVGRAIRIARNKELVGGRENSLSSKIVVVAFYFPPGNVASHFNENVHPPLIEPNIPCSSTNNSTLNQLSSLPRSN